MRLVADPGMAEWVGSLKGPEDFDWDSGNRTKNLKHGVTCEEIESLIEGIFVLVGRIVVPVHNEQRWLLLGRTVEGRKLTLVFTQRADRLRPISCRSMRAWEKRAYEKTNNTKTNNTTEEDGPQTH